MFTKTAAYYDALYHFKDYGAAALQLHELVQRCAPGATSLLDVACGTGKHLEYLRPHYRAEGIDLDGELLAVARQRCPGVGFQQADMTRFDLGRRFGAVVCLFSSIAYVQTAARLGEAVRCMVQHLEPGGLLLIEPWITPENYWLQRLTTNFVDQPDLKICWMYTSERAGDTSVFDIHYTVGTAAGVSSFREKHVMGLWTDAQYRQAFADVGIAATFVPVGLMGRGMYYGTKPA